MSPFTESTVEDAALAWLEGIGWRVAHGPDVAPDTRPSVEAVADIIDNPVQSRGAFEAITPADLAGERVAVTFG